MSLRYWILLGIVGLAILLVLSELAMIVFLLDLLFGDHTKDTARRTRKRSPF